MVAAITLVCWTEFAALKHKAGGCADPHAVAGRVFDAHQFGGDSGAGMGSTVRNTGVQSMMMVTGGKRDG
jgi:hypothetical protein